MGGALACGLVRKGDFPSGDLTVTARHAASLKKFSSLGIRTSLDNAEATAEAEKVFIAVKPWQIAEVAAQIAPVSGNGQSKADGAKKHIVSIAPGISPEDLKRLFGQDAAISYAIPNTAAKNGESMTFVSHVSATAEMRKSLEELLERVGKVSVVPTEQLLAGTAAASCGIAYALRYISAASEGALQAGLEPEVATGAIVQTVKGAVSLMEKGSGKASSGGSMPDPEAEIDKVTTPGGMTLRGLAAMEQAGFSDAVRKGIAAGAAKGRRIVVKVGSNVLTRDDGSLDTTRVSSIVDQIAALKDRGFDVVLVTSGAVACGRALVGENRKLDEVQRRQLYSAIGQVRLMDLYSQFFGDHGILVGQVLTQKKNFTGKKEYLNQRGCVEVMLQSGVLPVVNENDTVSITELMFTDNDELSGLVAAMVGAETLVILSNVDGLWSAEPGQKGAHIIRKVLPGDSAESAILPSKSSSGRGGMASKCLTARKAAGDGIHVLIANGKAPDILTRLFDDPEGTVHTEFVPAKNDSK